MKSNQDYKNSALAALKGNWAAAVVTIIVLFAIMTVLVAPGTVSNMSRVNGFQWGTMLYVMEGASFLITVFVLYPLSVGVSNSFRLLYAENDTEFIQMRLPQLASYRLGNVSDGVVCFSLESSFCDTWNRKGLFIRDDSIHHCGKSGTFGQSGH